MCDFFFFSCEGSNTLLRNDCNVPVSGNYLSVLSLRSLLLFLDWAEGNHEHACNIPALKLGFLCPNWANDQSTHACMVTHMRTLYVHVNETQAQNQSITEGVLLICGSLLIVNS